MAGGPDSWECRMLAEAGAEDLARGLRAGGARGVTLTVVPYQRRPVLPAAPRRRAAFLRHLDRIVAESFARAPGPDDPRRDARPHPPVLDAACALCQGHCCVPGGDAHAFLGVADIDRFRRAVPGATEAAARAAYAERLPERSVAGSCVFHGARGCTLTRELRSDTCNHLICRGQRLLAEGAGRGDSAAVLVAAPGNRPVAVATWTPDGGLSEPRPVGPGGPAGRS